MTGKEEKEERVRRESRVQISQKERTEGESTCEENRGNLPKGVKTRVRTEEGDEMKVTSQRSSNESHHDGPDSIMMDENRSECFSFTFKAKSCSSLLDVEILTACVCVFVCLCVFNAAVVRILRRSGQWLKLWRKTSRTEQSRISSYSYRCVHEPRSKKQFLKLWESYHESFVSYKLTIVCYYCVALILITGLAALMRC